MPRPLWRDGADDYEELLTTLGAILRQGDRAVKVSVLPALRQYGDVQEADVSKVTTPTESHLPEDLPLLPPSGYDMLC